MNEKVKSKAEIGRLYFFYLALVLLPQIIGFSAKGTIIDTAWKAAVIIGTLWYAFRKSGGKLCRYMVFPMGLYAVGQGIALISYGGNLKSSLINVFVILAMAYLFLSVSTSRVDQCFFDLYFFCNAFICLMLYAVVYNIIINTTAVLNFMSVSNVYSNMMSSFFDNKQTFGMFLFMALIVSTWQYILNQKKRYLLCIILFGFNIFICLSRTAIFACSVYIIAATVFGFHANRSLSKFFVRFITVLILAIFLIPQLGDFVSNVLFDTDATMNARTNIWDYAFDALHGTRLWIGYGEGNATVALWQVMGYGANSHNGIVQILLTGGILKLSIYIMVFLYALMCSLAIKRYNKTLAFLFVSTIVSVLVYSMGEALVLLDTSAPCIVASILCVAFPIRAKMYYLNKRSQRLC